VVKRSSILKGLTELENRGLNSGTSGNLSARLGSNFLITPSGAIPAKLTVDELVLVRLSRDGASNLDGLVPSSEWRMHHDIYTCRTEVRVVAHFHSPYATALACNGRGIPSFHYMVAVAGGENIRCAPYATFGSQALSDSTLMALEGRKACLLANHGVVCVGTDISETVKLATEIELLAKTYVLSLTIGSPNVLSGSEMKKVLTKFRTYGSK
jgi:L-fuculose-phosphate aldolase